MFTKPIRFRRRLEQIPFIRLERRTGIGALIEHLVVNAGIAPNDVMELDTLRGIMTMVDEGFGVAILPQRSLPDNSRQPLYDSTVHCACNPS